MVALTVSADCHPSCLAEEQLLKFCSLRNDRRSGPGGQHRNKVETAVIVVHQVTGISAEASESRHQSENRKIALERLRLNLAIKYRSSAPAAAPSPLWRQRSNRGRIAISSHHSDFPCLLAELLDCLQVLDYSLPDCAEFFAVTSSQLVKLLRKWPPALVLVNAARAARGMHRLD